MFMYSVVYVVSCFVTKNLIKYTVNFPHLDKFLVILVYVTYYTPYEYFTLTSNTTDIDFPFVYYTVHIIKEIKSRNPHTETLCNN